MFTRQYRTRDQPASISSENLIKAHLRMSLLSLLYVKVLAYHQPLLIVLVTALSCATDLQSYNISVPQTKYRSGPLSTKLSVRLPCQQFDYTPSGAQGLFWA